MFILSDAEDHKEINDIKKLTIIIPLEDNIAGTIKTYKSVRDQRDIDIITIISINGKKAEAVAGKIKKNVAIGSGDKIITCFQKGKAYAINNALNYVDTEWFGVIDSDCELKNSNALKLLCDSINDKTIAAGGRLQVRRKVNPITVIQDMEYKRTFLHRRQICRDLKCVTLISGAFGLFKKEIVEKSGGYCTDFVGEDMKIVLRIQRFCHRAHIKYDIAYEPRAVCITSVPGNPYRLFRQRDRWQRGLIGSLLRNTTFRFDKGIAMQLIAMPYIFAFDIAGPVLWAVCLVKEAAEYIAEKVYTLQEKNLWIAFLLVYVAMEITIDLLTEWERSELDHERLKIVAVIGVVLMQIPKHVVNMLVIMPARVYGTLTYPWRKNVW